LKTIRFLVMVLLLGISASTARAQAALKVDYQNLREGLVEYAQKTSPQTLVSSGVKLAKLAAPTGGGIPPAEAVCPCCGEIWSAPNQEKGEAYGPTPLGGIFEACPIVGQIWREILLDPNNPQGEKKSEVVVFGIRPESMIFLEGYRGGTAWNFPGPVEEIWEDLKKQERELVATYPQLSEDDVWVVLFPDDIDKKVPMVKEARTQAILSGEGNPGSNPGNNSSWGLGTISGPAIVESSTEDGEALVVKLNSGQSRYFPREGSAFPFPEQAALDERWPSHLVEFRQRFANGKVEGA